MKGQLIRPPDQFKASFSEPGGKGEVEMKKRQKKMIFKLWWEVYRGKNATWGNAIILVCSARPLGKPKREYEEALKKLVQQNSKAFFSSTIPDKYCDIFLF